MARNALMANRRLHLACAALRPGEWEAARVSFFPSLKAPLNHILIVDRFYVDALEGGTLGPAAWADREPCADVSDLALAQEAMDRRVLAICDALTGPDLDRLVSIHRATRVQVETLGDTLLHLFLHDQHHRGQAHAMLSGTSVAPPQLDEFVMRDDAAARADDLAWFGWTEDSFSWPGEEG
jgi:uncharacterized damage-inducible protein DinB